MTRSSSNTVFHEAASGHSPVYVEKPDIPEGMTVPRGAGGAGVSRSGVCCHMCRWLRWHQLREALS